MRSSTITCTLKTSPEKAFAYISALEHLLEWAPEFADSLTQEGGRWLAQRSKELFEVRIVSDPRSGVIDFQKLKEGRLLATSPSRVVENGADTEYIFTFFQASGMTDDAFNQTLAGMQDEFDTLNRILAKQDHCP